MTFADPVMKNKMLKILILVAGLYLLLCGLLFFFQENLIFFPQKLARDHQFSFDQETEEINIHTKDNRLLHAVLFKADSSKGVIFYLHGNAGSLDSWGEEAGTFTRLNYDVFMLDYRGYGKSEGAIDGQEQFFGDIQTVYDELKKTYAEDKITVLGYSIGTGPAARLASTNNPARLIFQAPYYSLTDMVKHTYPIIPTFILKYKFETGEYLKNCKMPVVIFHGDQDEVIYYGSSLKLKAGFKERDTLITLPGQAHNGMGENPGYLFAMQKVLN
jgi:pimeloyl-ACP methyl ester carboxylesterase